MIQPILQIFTKLLGIKQDDQYSDYVLKNILRLFLLHAASIVIGFLSNYTFIRLVGVQDYGSYVYIFNLLYLLAGFCILGVDTLLVKKISIYDEAKQFGELKGVVSYSFTVAIIGSFVFAVISSGATSITGVLKYLGNNNWFMLAYPVLLMLSLTQVNQSSLQGLKKIFLSQVTEKLIRPLLVFIFVLIPFLAGEKIALRELIRINVLAMGLAFFVTYVFFQKNIGSKLKGIKPEFELKEWSYSSLAFFLIGALYVLNSRVDIFFLGFFKGNDDVGVYNIVLKISEVIGFSLVLINFTLAPVIARMYANGEIANLQKMITRSAQIVLALSIPVVLVIIFFTGNILLFFGDSFLTGRTALLVLCLGQLINIFSGSVGMLLMMSGNQRFSIYSLVASTVLNISLNIILIPRYGILGAAIANAASMVVWNFLMYFFVRTRVKIRPTAFGVI
ncbi:MAG: flippase [Bacteroidota bacterium]